MQPVDGPLAGPSRAALATGGIGQRRLAAVVGRDAGHLRHQLAQCHGPLLFRELGHVHLNFFVETQHVFLQQQPDGSRGERFGCVCNPEPSIWCDGHLVLEIRPAEALGPNYLSTNTVTVDADRHRESRQVLLRETGAHDLSPAFHCVGPFSRRGRMRHGSHLLRVRVQDRRRDALISPEPYNRRERQADGPDDQRKPDWDSILRHVPSIQSRRW